MSDLFEDYEKDFGVISADIVAKTGKIPNVQGGMYSLSFVSICDNTNEDLCFEVKKPYSMRLFSGIIILFSIFFCKDLFMTHI